MIKVYGRSDDLVEVEGTKTEYDEIGCYDEDVFIAFKDGSKIRVYYNKPNMGVWGIDIQNKGTAQQSLTICEDEDADIYSDIFEIDSDITSVVVGKER